MKSRIKKAIAWGIFYSILTVFFLEIILRILGYGAYYNVDYKVSSTPKGAYIGDSLLGIRLNKGEYFITLNDSVSFTANHKENNERYIPQRNDNLAQDVVFLGCSFAYGYGVNDHECFPSLLQEQYLDYGFNNKSVVGYGSTQSLIQLQKLIENHVPKVVLLNFSSFHFMRNGLSQAYRSNLRIGYRRASEDADKRLEKARFPFRKNNDDQVYYATWDKLYNNWPGRTFFRTINIIQSNCDKRIDRKIDASGITKDIMKEMNTLCKKHGVQFGIVCLDDSPETTVLEKQIADIPWRNIHFNFSDKQLTHLPYDSHPNAQGHQFIADEIQPFLDSLLSK